jgi:NIPSNAP
MIYELRTSTVRQRSLSEVVKALSTVSLEIREDNYGKLEGCWQTEIGPLNQVLELWSYQDLNQRARLLAELDVNPRWRAEYMPLLHPHLIRQDVRLLNEVRAPKAPVQTPNILRVSQLLDDSWCRNALASALHRRGGSAREIYQDGRTVGNRGAAGQRSVSHLGLF